MNDTKSHWEESSVIIQCLIFHSDFSQWLVVWICRIWCLKRWSSKGKLLCVIFVQVQHISRHLIITRPSSCITKYRSHFTINPGSNQFSILNPLPAAARESIRLLNPVSTDSFCSHRRRRDTESYKYPVSVTWTLKIIWNNGSLCQRSFITCFHSN